MSGDGFQQTAIARYKGIVFISSDAQYIEQAIRASKEKSLAENESYRSIMAKLPDSRLLTVFASRDFPQQLTQISGATMITGMRLPVMDQSIGLALSLVDAGIRADVIAAYDLDLLSETEIENLSARGADGKLAASLPRDTLAFLTGYDLSRNWQILMGSITQGNEIGAAEVEEAMALLEAQIGFNPSSDLLPYLDEEWVIAITRESDSLLAQQIGMPMGPLGIYETTQLEPLMVTARNTTEILNSMGVLMIDEQTLDDMTLYTTSDFSMGRSIFAYGIQGNRLLLGTSSNRLETLADISETPDQSDPWKNTWDAIPAGMDPIFYLDFQGWIDLAPQMFGGNAQYLQPIQTLAVAGSPLDGNTKHILLLVTIDKE